MKRLLFFLVFVTFVISLTVLSQEIKVNKEVQTGLSLADLGAMALLDVSPSVVFTAKVNEAGGITKGQPVYISGATGNKPRVSLTDNTVSGKHEFAGLAAETKTNGQTILVLAGGELTGVDGDGDGALTASNEAWSDGDLLYISATGYLTNVLPTNGAADHIGYVSYNHGTNGEFLVTSHKESYISVASGENIDLRMGDTAGANKILFEDYNDVEVGAVNSNGNLWMNDVLSIGTLSVRMSTLSDATDSLLTFTVPSGIPTITGFAPDNSTSTIKWDDGDIVNVDGGTWDFGIAPTVATVTAWIDSSHVGGLNAADIKDTELSALAGLTAAADRLPYFTSGTAASLATFTSFGRSIIDDADEATFKATVNLEIGTDVQAYDADLATLAASTAWRIFHSNGSSVITELAFGADGTYLRSNGASAALTFSSIAGGGDMMAADFADSLSNHTGVDVQAYDADLATLAAPTNWRIFHSNGSNTITELALGANGTFLESNGVSAAPGFRTLTDGDIPTTLTLETISGTPVVTNGIAIGTDQDANLIDDTTTGAGSTTLWIGNESILASGDIGTSVLAEQTIGIADNNLLEVDHVSPADNDYAKFTTVGIEGRSYTEVKTDLSLNNVENTALTTWAGTSNIATTGTVTTGTWASNITLGDGEFITLPAPGGISDLTATGKRTTLTAGYTTAIGDIVFLDPTDSKLTLTDCDFEASTGDVGVYVVLEVKSDTQACLVLIEGWMRDDSSYAFTAGKAVFIGNTAGEATTTQSTTTGDFLRIIGHAFNGDVFYFDPDGTWLEI